jgi:hypothetical protein
LRRGLGAAGWRLYGTVRHGTCLLRLGRRRRRCRARTLLLPTYQPTYLHLSIHIYRLLLPIPLALTCPALPYTTLLLSSLLFLLLLLLQHPRIHRPSAGRPRVSGAARASTDADADADAGSNQTRQCRRLRRIAGRGRGASRIIGLRSAVSRAEDTRICGTLRRGERGWCGAGGRRGA